MFVTTFYSFKGGVGRTMALMNVAMDLVQQGRRVLLVDFDLEAPGIPTYNVARVADDKPGIVDFIHEYLATGTTPAVGPYLHEVAPPGGEGALFVMPSGRRDKDYGARLSAIDWGRLYAEREGFLLLEDLRQQWETACKPDYVLIDSRTGHTDVGGICTRQLPDALVMLFFPNDQNLFGLKSLVDEVRTEAFRAAKTLFVPSNVPLFDDGERILAKRLERFQRELQYEEPAAVIHHNNALALLDQSVYTVNYPDTLLAKEYQMLTLRIQHANAQADLTGAIACVNGIVAEVMEGNLKGAADKWEVMLKSLDKMHGHNPKMAERLRKLRVLMASGAEILREHSNKQGG